MSMTVICIKNELYKIFGTVKYKLFIGVTAAMTVCNFLAGTLTASHTSFFGGNYPYLILSLCCYLFIPFASFSLTADIISGEFERNEMKLLAARHISRSELILGKLGATVVYDMLLTLANVISAAILTVIFCGISSVSLISVFVSLLITVLPIMTVTTFSGMISLLCKTSISAFAAELAGFAFACIMPLIFSNMNRAFFTSYLAIYKMTIGQTIPVFEIIMGAAVLIASALMFLPCSCLIFEKKDI